MNDDRPAWHEVTPFGLCSAVCAALIVAFLWACVVVVTA